jgi:FtsH-binding integral membrane protein
MNWVSKTFLLLGIAIFISGTLLSLFLKQQDFIIVGSALFFVCFIITLTTHFVHFLEEKEDE